MKVAIYTRVSTELQELNNQITQLEKYCEENKYDIYKIYKEIISGKETSRPVFDEMFRDAYERKFDMILFWDLSRFSRAGVLYTLQKLKELDNIRIKWHSYREPYISNVGEFRDVILSIMATLAKVEREQLRDRIKAGLKHAKKVGKRGKDKKPRKKSGYYKRYENK